MGKQTNSEPRAEQVPAVQTPASGGSYVLDESGAHQLTERTQEQSGTYRVKETKGE